MIAPFNGNKRETAGEVGIVDSRRLRVRYFWLMF